MSAWVNVEDRMPEFYQKVIVRVLHKDPEKDPDFMMCEFNPFLEPYKTIDDIQGQFFPKLFGFNGYCPNHWEFHNLFPEKVFFESKITHWMPLPEISPTI